MPPNVCSAVETAAAASEAASAQATAADCLPRATDLTDLLVPAMRVHQKSPFKAVMGNPTMDMINMAGGVPHPATFPLLQLQAKVKAPARGAGGQDATLVLDKTQPRGTVESLDELLQYGAGCGVDSYCRFLRKHTQLVHSPRYADWDVIASCGSTDAIGKAISLFCDVGDSIAVEQWTFPGALSSLARGGVAAVPVAMDGEGMMPAALDRACISSRDSGRPLRVVYVVPTGQNPTGATMSLARRKAIYAVAQKHNLAIIEDDPYYFLQLGPPSPEQDGRAAGAAASDSEEYDSGCDAPAEEQPAGLLPSLLALDTDGRVVRLDSFSKIMAPNLRCGWITAPTYILDRLQILNESTILQPSGLSQGVVSRLLNDVWGLDGWDAHLRDLRTEYRLRRNLFVRMARKHLAGLAEFAVPTAGMFVWIKVTSIDPADPAATQRLLGGMRKAGVMMAPATPFCSAGPAGAQRAGNHLRAAFALVDTDMFEPALQRLAQAIVAAAGGAPAS
ncbi:hypothetical protein LPJ61_002189 [Coemansia biformis]|uniref:Aminotransferase class I/classII large domain-containing protein n=1 Tax=Coemansia biformis TaxID=1286918 RepID=A0A9W7YEJ9_9FUNG|nr:hypothetical protein LPJ61_002189 [Coemansia biformis]